MRDQDIDGGAGELAAGGHLVGRNRRGQARRVGGDAQLIGQPFQRLRQILFLRGQHDLRAIGRRQQAGLARIGEEAHRRARAGQHQASRVLELGHGQIDRIGQPVHRRAGTAALDAAIGGLGDQAHAGGAGDPARRFQRAAQRGAAQHQHGVLAAADGIGARTASAEVRGAASRAAITGADAPAGRSVQAASAGRISVAILPGSRRATATASAASAEIAPAVSVRRTNATWAAPRPRHHWSAVRRTAHDRWHDRPRH